MEHELDSSRKFIDNLQHINSQNAQNPLYEQKYEEWENAKNVYY